MLLLHLAGKLDVEQRRGRRWVASSNDPERWAGRGRLIVLEGEPPGVDVAEGRATHLVVVGLRVGDTGHSFVGGRARYWPARLSAKVRSQQHVQSQVKEENQGQRESRSARSALEGSYIHTGLP